MAREVDTAQRRAEAEYREVYRGIGFHKTCKGYWLFDEQPPAGKWRHWSRYVDIHRPEGAQAMRDAIDRMHNDAPCYTGDLRDRLREGVDGMRCAECGMPCLWGDYHPYAACLMFKQCHNSETVLANLKHVQNTARQAILVEAVKEIRSRKAADDVADNLNETLSFDTFNAILESIATNLDQRHERLKA